MAAGAPSRSVGRGCRSTARSTRGRGPRGRGPRTPCTSSSGDRSVDSCFLPPELVFFHGTHRVPPLPLLVLTGATGVSCGYQRVVAPFSLPVGLALAQPVASLPSGPG